MLTYCFVPVQLPFEVARPALIKSLDVCQELITAAERTGWSTLYRMGLTDGNGPDVVVFEYRQPLLGSTQVTIPITCSSKSSSLMSMDGDMTLSRLASSLCHLSIRSSSSSEWASSLVYAREFQMVMEMAVACFLDHLVHALTTVSCNQNLSGQVTRRRGASATAPRWEGVLEQGLPGRVPY